ncbi:nuclear transport factor 2 family protein [Mycolicibacterium llatzerense]|uniref:nuclear transport factor 2 family protein n=1 Tax=Mycolicibacterium llatzerense TaxID=280871 RepID=UPI00360F5DC0
MPKFWERVGQQEKLAIERGLPAEGMFDFAQVWFSAWAEQDIKKIDYCLADECSYIDSSTFQVNKEGRQFTIDNCQASFDIFPDFAFYPQDGTIRSLPYADYFEGQWRITIPWRGVGRMTGETVVPGLDVTLRGTGRCLNFIGIDRYTLTDDFKISHIDTDWDMLYGAAQLAGIGSLVHNERLQKIGIRTASAMSPIVRALTRLTTR